MAAWLVLVSVAGGAVILIFAAIIVAAYRADKRTWGGSHY